MLRRGIHGLQRGIQQASRSLHTSQAVRGDSSSVLSFPSWLSSGALRVGTPLTDALPGVDPESGFKGPNEPPPTLITTLDNGVRIVSEASLGPTASMGLYVDSGSIYETQQTTGATAMLECLAFKASKHRDTLRIMKEVELLGANIAANGSREQMSYTIDCLRSHVPAALELLCDCVINPAFRREELDEQKFRLQMLLSSPEVQLTLLTELLVRAAYDGALGHPLIPDPDNLHHLTPDTLSAFVRQNYTGKRLVLAGAGLEHQQLVELATPMLKDLPAGPAEYPNEPPSTYKGAKVLLPGEAPAANLILAFEYGGGWRDIQGSVIMTVLTYLLGGGNSFSSGGPGKGMHSRLYTRVLNHYHWVQSCSSFNNTLNNSGLVGIQASCEPSKAQHMLDIMCRELESLTVPPPPDQLERAKAMSVSLIQGALESKAASAEDLGRQILTYGHRVNVRDYETMIQSVSAKQIAEFTRRLLSSKPSLAAFGDGTHVLDYDALVKRFTEAKWSQRSSNPMGLQGPAAGDGQMVHGVFERLKKGLSMGGGGRGV